MLMERFSQKLSNVAPQEMADIFGYFAKETLSAPGNGEWILIPNGSISISAALDAISGSGKVQATLDLEAIRNNTAPSGIVDWTPGSISGAVDSDVLNPAIAVRQVNASGTTILTIVAS